MKSVIHKKRPAHRPAEFREEFKLHAYLLLPDFV